MVDQQTEAASPGSPSEETTGRPALLGAGLLAGAGSLDFLAGLARLNTEPFVIVTRNGLYHVDFSAWAWLNLSVGVAVTMAGLVVVADRRWAVSLGIVAASASIALHLLAFPYHPWRAIVVGILAGAAIRLLIRHRRCLTPDRPGRIAVNQAGTPGR